MSHLAEHDDDFAASTDGNAEKLLVESPVCDCDRRPYGDRAVILAEATDEELFSSTPTVVCCPNCAEALETYETGLPAAVAQFNERCSTCKTELRRWSAVAIDAAYRDLVDVAKLTELTQAYWHARLQAGITNIRGEVRNDEYEELFQKMATVFGWDWEKTCPLCRRHRPIFDYHHWTETPDQGIILCRQCHNVISFEMADYQLEERVRELGLSSRIDLQTLRLGLREAIVTDRTLRPEMAAHLVERYNLFQSTAEVAALLKALCDDEQLYDHIVDDDLWNGFDQ